MINTVEELFEDLSDEQLEKQIASLDSAVNRAKVSIVPDWLIAVTLLEARSTDPTIKIALQLGMVVAHKELAEREQFRRSNEA